MSDGDRIVAVGPADDSPRAAGLPRSRTSARRSRDPGFVDAHCHLEWSLLDGVLEPGTVRRLAGAHAGAADADDARRPPPAAAYGALRALRAGTTTAADNGPTGAGAAAMAAARAARRRSTSRPSAPTTVTRPRAPRAPWPGAWRPSTPQAGRGVRVGLSPHAPYTVGPALLGGARGRAASGRAPVGHPPGRVGGTRNGCRRGDGPLGELFAAGRASRPGAGTGPTGRRSCPGSPRAAACAAGWSRPTACGWGRATRRCSRDAGVTVAHCPRSNAFLHCGTAPLAAMLAAGPRVGLGTDSPASGGDFDLRAEARDCGRRTASRRAELLRLATRAAPRRSGPRTRSDRWRPACAPTWWRCGRPGRSATRPRPPWTRRRGRAGGVGRRAPDRPRARPGGRRRGPGHPGRRGSQAALVASEARAPRPEAHSPVRPGRRDPDVAGLRGGHLRRARAGLLRRRRQVGRGPGARRRQARVQEQPNNPEAYEELASAYAARTSTRRRSTPPSRRSPSSRTTSSGSRRSSRCSRRPGTPRRR